MKISGVQSNSLKTSSGQEVCEISLEIYNIGLQQTNQILFAFPNLRHGVYIITGLRAIYLSNPKFKLFYR